MFIHLFLNAVKSFGANNETVQWRTHIFIKKNFHWTGNYFLVWISNSSQTKTFCFLVEYTTLFIFLDLKELLDTFLNGHESWRFIDFLVFKDVLLCSFFNLNVYKNKSMKIIFSIDSDFIIKTVRSPFFSPKRYWNCFTESINLKTSATDSTNDTGVVDDFNFNA